MSVLWNRGKIFIVLLWITTNELRTSFGEEIFNSLHRRLETLNANLFPLNLYFSYFILKFLFCCNHSLLYLTKGLATKWIVLGAIKAAADTSVCIRILRMLAAPLQMCFLNHFSPNNIKETFLFWLAKTNNAVSDYSGQKRRNSM